MKIAFFELEGWEDRIILDAFASKDTFLSQERLIENHLPKEKDAEVISIFLYSKISKTVLDHFPKLKMITTRSTGYDHIDLSACKRRGIAVCNVPGHGDNTVAEFAFGMLISLTRHVYTAVRQVKEEALYDIRHLRGIDLYGKTMGIIGTGRIGSYMVRIAKGFGMNVLAHDLEPNEKLQKEVDFEYTLLDHLLAKSDVISIHVPYSKKTHHLLNKENMKKIKRGSFLINTARGGIVETNALVEAIREGTLGGAALDVFEGESEMKDEFYFMTHGRPKAEEVKTLLYDHMLFTMPNVLVTPHTAFNSQEALERILRYTIENIKFFIALNPQNIVPMDKETREGV